MCFELVMCDGVLILVWVCFCYCIMLFVPLFEEVLLEECCFVVEVM